MKFCVDCKYCSGPWGRHTIPPPPNWPLCYAKVSYIDPVYGDKHYEPCKTARVTFCGPEAKLFEPKPKKVTFFQRMIK